MDGSLLLQLFLLDQMRADDLVRTALRSLGATTTDLAAARPKAELHGLATPGHAMSIYADLLGKAPHEEHLESQGEYRQVVQHYHLPLWPDLRFTVWGDASRRTGAVGFTVGPHAPRFERLTTEVLTPWHTVEEQLTAALRQGRVSDEWYPLKDYECSLQSSGSSSMAKFVLRFDFNLLQEVVPV